MSEVAGRLRSANWYPQREVPGTSTALICRHHNYSTHGCNKHTIKGYGFGMRKCKCDHVHCHHCLEVGHAALECKEFRATLVEPLPRRIIKS